MITVGRDFSIEADIDITVSDSSQTQPALPPPAECDATALGRLTDTETIDG